MYIDGTFLVVSFVTHWDTTYYKTVTLVYCEIQRISDSNHCVTSLDQHEVLYCTDGA